MKTEAIGKLFTNGGSQAVRLPKDFRLPGTEVRITRHGSGVLLEPVEFDVDAWIAEFQELGKDPTFFPNGREQPPMPEGDGPDFD